MTHWDDKIAKLLGENWRDYVIEQSIFEDILVEVKAVVLYPQKDNPSDLFQRVCLVTALALL